MARKVSAPVREPNKQRKSSDSTASELDLGSRTVDNFRHLQQYPEICNDFRERRIGWKEARRRAKIADRENRIRVRETDNAAKPKAEAPYRLIHADIANVAEIPDGSLTAIITDPPYPKEFASCYTKLAEFAVNKLAVGGNLVVLTGQANLFDFAQPLLERADLSYVWTLCWNAPGASTQVFGRKVNLGIATNPGTIALGR